MAFGVQSCPRLCRLHIRSPVSVPPVPSAPAFVTRVWPAKTREHAFISVKSRAFAMALKLGLYDAHSRAIRFETSPSHAQRLFQSNYY